MSREDSDAVSDIDINLVVSEKDSASLCMRSTHVSAQTSPERYSLMRQFGLPALIHENNHNAPKDGTFTSVLYAESAILVDWTLIPQTSARRPLQSKILFDIAGIPISNSPEMESLDQSRKLVAEQWAFFWMMAAITTKYIIRGDGVFVTQWIEYLNGMIQDIERHLNRSPRSYTRGSISQLQPTSEKQVESIRKMCNRMQNLQPTVFKFTESELSMPLKEIETMLSLVNK
ncbi:MAG: hypothetical protein U0Z26_05855 [Anaerolineales bacterium]